MGEALLRFSELRCEPLALREFVVVGALEAALEFAQDLSKQMRVGKALSLLVPARILSRALLVSGVALVMANIDSLRVDFPKVRAAGGAR